MIPKKAVPLVAAATLAIFFGQASLSGGVASAAASGQVQSSWTGLAHRRIEDDSVRTRQERRSYLPLVMFGAFGALLGAWIGGHLAPEEPDDGKLPSRLLPEEAEVGGFIGLVVGAALGYYLGSPRDSVTPLRGEPSSLTGRPRVNRQGVQP